MKKLLLVSLMLFVAFAPSAAGRKKDSFARSFVQVSRKNPHYFCLSDGQTYIPIGCNIAAMGSVKDMEHYLAEMHRYGANFGRVWLNTNLFEIEPRYGAVDTVKLARIDRLLELASEYGIKIKFCIESFRHIAPRQGQVGYQSVLPHLERRPVRKLGRIHRFAAGARRVPEACPDFP